MIDFIKTWSKEEFKLYLLIYAAQANLVESDEELDFIKSKFDSQTIDSIYQNVKDLNDFGAVNEVYGAFFDEHNVANYPARSCVEVARLPKDVLIEIEAIAVRK